MQPNKPPSKHPILLGWIDAKGTLLRTLLVPEPYTPYYLERGDWVFIARDPDDT